MKAISSALALLAATSPDAHGFKSNNALTSRHTPLAFVNPTLSRHNSQISNHYASLSRPTNRRLTPLLSLSRRPEESDNQKPASNNEPHHPLCQLVQKAQTHVEAQMTELFKQIKNPMDLLLDQAAVQSKISRNEAPVIQTALTVAAVKMAAGVLDKDPITPKLVGKELLLAMRVMVSFAPNFF